MRHRNYFVVFRFDTYRALYKFRFDTWDYLSRFRFDTYLSTFCASLGFVSTHLLVIPLHVTVSKAVELKNLRVENTRSSFSRIDNPCKPTNNRYLTHAQRLLKAMFELCSSNASKLISL